MMLAPEQVIEELREAGALLEGHFLLSSGMHSPRYIQCARALMDPRRAERLGRALGARIRDGLRETGAQPPDLVASPALGGIVLGHETARALGLCAVFTEREAGRMCLRRGFTVRAGARVVLVEDVVTTGRSLSECGEAVAEAGGHPVLAACLVDRSDGRAEIGLRLVSLVRLAIPVYPAHAVPPELARIPATKPGSRGLA